MTSVDIAEGWHADPSRSHSLRAAAYTDQRWFDTDQAEIIAKSWQWICHGEKLRSPGSYVAEVVAGMPIVAVRGTDGALRAFYNVCKHRAHMLLEGEGTAANIVCPYHAWSYDLSGQLRAARHTGHLHDFAVADICLDEVQITELGGFVFVNLDPDAAPLEEQSGDLAAEIAHWAPDVEHLTFAHRLTYEIESNWKNVVDNFLECYHCHVAHTDFVSLVDMGTYRVTTHGIYSSHMAEAGKSTNSAYDVSNATVTDHAVWWLWPNTCMMRYPGRGNMIVLKIIPMGPDLTYETYDFFLESPDPNEAELESIRYLDDVLQVEDIALVESVQRGMHTPAFDQGRIVNDPSGSGLSEHAVHHFHGLVLNAYQGATQ
ncbi:MAG: ring-hydroxylating oxygenase subunit alpha [Actinomycetota bacterium]